MSLIVLCQNPDCGKKFRVPESNVAKKFRCEACGKISVIAVPFAEAVPAEPQAAEPQAKSTAISEQPRPAKTTPQPQQAAPNLRSKPDDDEWYIQSRTADSSTRDDAAKEMKKAVSSSFADFSAYFQ